jgi:hypothetical protein
VPSLPRVSVTDEFKVPLWRPQVLGEGAAAGGVEGLVAKVDVTEVEDAFSREGVGDVQPVFAKPHRASRLYGVSCRGGDHRGGDRCHAHVSGEHVIAGDTSKHEERGENTPSERSGSSGGRSLTAAHYLTRTHGLQAIRELSAVRTMVSSVGEEIYPAASAYRAPLVPAGARRSGMRLISDRPGYRPAGFVSLSMA